MKRLAVLGLLLGVAASPASAGDVAVPFDDQAQMVAFQMPALLDACVASLTLRGDATACKAVSGGLVAIGNMVKAAQTKAAEKAAADKAAADKERADAKAAADKAAADKAAAESKPKDDPQAPAKPD